MKHINEKALAETLQHGVGFYHEALSKQDKRIVEELFESGTIQVVVALRDTCWALILNSLRVKSIDMPSNWKREC